MLRFSPNPNLANLIHWFEWEQDAFRKAHEQDKPVMLFLSAFWCRYCQRMDEGAFSERENMALLNAYFIALRVENGMRPDIDARYNLNGWPTIAFFTPGGELLAAANFLPTEEFKNLLLNVYMGYQQMSMDERTTPPAAVSETVMQARLQRSRAEMLDEVTAAVLAQADRVHGGYGHGQKFIHPSANDFLLSRYEATQNTAYLEHVCLTLDQMREGQIHDAMEGGYFRTTTGVDWSQPHREKLLSEQAGLLSNCLRVLRLTGRAEYARMAEEIIGYLDKKLFDTRRGAFFGCQDFLRRESGASSAEDFFSIVDECIYTDANAQAAGAYLEAASLLDRPDCKQRALNVLEFIWDQCRNSADGIFHYHDGAPRLPGLLDDQAQLGAVLVQAYRASGDAKYLERARETAAWIIGRLTNPAGGYYDLVADGSVLRRFPLTDLDRNGEAAIFFLALAGLVDDSYREFAHRALDAFDGDFSAYGIHAARFGRALGEWLRQK